MRQSLTYNRWRRCPSNATAPAPLLEGDSAESGCAEQQRLLQDQDEGGRNHVTRIAAGRIVERLRQQADRSAANERGMSKAAIEPCAACRGFQIDRSNGLGNALQHAVIEEEIG